MGIPQLLRCLAPLTRPEHVSIYARKTVAVDASCWLHRASYNCATELALNQPTDKYLRFLRSLVRTLLSNEVRPLLVFDGAALPAKQATSLKRQQRRNMSYALGMEFYQNNMLERANEQFQRSVHVTGAMTAAFQTLLRSLNVPFIVAPYEADAQIAHLFAHRVVDGVISEDSDLIPYGCNKIFIKMDKNGNGLQVDMTALQQAEATNSPYDSFITRLKKLTADDSNNLLTLCVLAGCDYLPSVRGVGLRVAARMMSKWGSVDLVMNQLKLKRKRSEKSKVKRGLQSAANSAVVTTMDNFDSSESDDALDTSLTSSNDVADVDSDSEVLVGKQDYTDAYPFEFHRACLTFLHQMVYDTKLKKYVHRTPLPKELSRLTQNKTTMENDKEIHIISDSEEDDSRLDNDNIIDNNIIFAGDISLSTRLSESSARKHNSMISDLSFLGAPPPAELAEELVNGTIDPKTMKPHEKQPNIIMPPANTADDDDDVEDDTNDVENARASFEAHKRGREDGIHLVEVGATAKRAELLTPWTSETSSSTMRSRISYAPRAAAAIPTYRHADHADELAAVFGSNTSTDDTDTTEQSTTSKPVVRLSGIITPSRSYASVTHTRRTNNTSELVFAPSNTLQHEQVVTERSVSSRTSYSSDSSGRDDRSSYKYRRTTSITVTSSKKDKAAAEARESTGGGIMRFIKK